MATVLLGLGSNLGDRETHIKHAIEFICAQSRANLIAMGPIIETEPVGVLDQQLFLNTAVLITTDLSPEALLLHAQGIEADLGRVSKGDYAPRPIDIDILLYDQVILDTPTLTIPHPRFAERVFALGPSAAIVPDWVHPVLHQSIQILYKDLK